jgi:signal peptidase I
MLLRWKPSRVLIEGPSMAPTLLPGDWALTVEPHAYRRGDVVVVQHPARPGYEMVKRVVGVAGDVVDGRRLASGEWWLEGDDVSSSTDSRQFGPVRSRAITARVVAVYGPRGRRRLIRGCVRK